MGNGRKPPNPLGVPKSHGKKPSAPKPHSNSGKFGCAVTALALAGGVLGTFGAIGYGAWQVIS